MVLQISNRLDAESDEGYLMLPRHLWELTCLLMVASVIAMNAALRGLVAYHAWTSEVCLLIIDSLSSVV